METWRLIRDIEYSGIDNMAIDRAICLACGEGRLITTLRMYGWIKPTLSIGYNQKLTEVDREFCNASSIDIIRRPTGGDAVLHEDEVTFSISSSTENILFPKSITQSHKKISLALMAGMRGLGIDAILQEKSLSKIPKNPNCFATPSIYELTLNGKKIVGSAQRRYKKSFLEHGSAKLKIDRHRLSAIFLKPYSVQFSQDNLALSDEESMKGICELPQNNFTEEQIKEAIISGFKQVFEIEFENGLLTEYELDIAKKFKLNYFPLDLSKNP